MFTQRGKSGHIQDCIIPRFSLKTGTTINWFLITWPWLNSNANVYRSWYKHPVIKAWWKVAWQKQGSYFFEFFKFLDFPWLFPCPFLLFDDHRFSCHFLKLWKLLVTCFSIFLALKQFNRNKLWYPPKCVLFALFNYSSLSYVILALSSAAGTAEGEGLEGL